MENQMNELMQELVSHLQEEHVQSLDSHPYFSIFGNEYGLIVDWNTRKVDVPSAIRVICRSDEDNKPGYLACIRFDVNPSDDINDPQQANFLFDEAEYDLEGADGRIDLLKELLEDIF